MAEKLMAVDDSARAINRYLQSVAKTFGINSAEYHQAEKMVVHDIIAGNQKLLRRTPDGVIQIKRGKTLEQLSKNTALQKNLHDLRKKQQKKKNTIANMKRKYADALKKQGEKATKSNIRQMAEHEFSIKNNSDSFYESNVRVIHDHEELRKLWSDAGTHATWKAGVHNEFYDLAVEATKAIMEEDQARLEQVLEKHGNASAVFDLSEFS